MSEIMRRASSPPGIDWRDHPSTNRRMGLTNGFAAAAEYVAPEVFQGKSKIYFSEHKAHLRFFTRAVHEFMP